ncbi:MAG: flotillin family protein, partial [Coriobacteriales bacterium]|nr:flotillin family protein [Coriobacteriales bacterium]
SIAEAEREAELRQREVLVKQQELAAQIEKQADAEKYRVEREAEAALAQRQRDAEAVKYEQQQEAEAQKALAEAARFAAEQEAAGIRAKGEAEAAAILAKGNAEAEAMERKAEAYAKYGRAAVTQMIVEVLPSIAREVAAPMASIDKVTVIGSDASGVSSVSNNVGAVMARLFETVQETTGLDLREVVKAETYDAKVNRNITVEGLPDGTKVDVKVDATTTGNPYAQV